MNLDEEMPAPVTRLVTFVDIDDGANSDTFSAPAPASASVSARHEVELADGIRVLLLNDRGWAESGPPNIWAHTRVEDIINTARSVVRPDEPVDGRSLEDTQADHWDELERVARGQGVAVSAAELQQLRHDVELIPRLRRRLLD